MPAFDELRRELQTRRVDADRTRVLAEAARERLARLRSRERVFERSFDPTNREHVAERERRSGQIAEATKRAETASRDAREASRLEIEAVAGFAALQDPREAITHLEDRFPILMLPVRLETRFQPRLPTPQLWVRIYPDDCSIDTFEPMISENEVTRAQLYWCSMWAAGGITEEERGAWRGLAGSQGSGRAEWIVSHYRPVEGSPRPTKSSRDDLILVIGTEAPPSAAEQQALADYWTAFWISGGEEAAVRDAADALSAAVGGEFRANQLTREFVPFNLKTKPKPPRTRSETTVTTTFLVFPESEHLDVKRHSWSRAAKAVLMPDRFVFLGYQAGTLVASATGEPVSPSLAVTPDPAAAEEDQIRPDEATGELLFPEDLRWIADFDRAVACGMGLRIDLTPDQATNGFDRVLVLGLRASADAETARVELETLIARHHSSRDGFAIVPQGTPTNNTELAESGYSRWEDPDVRFDELSQGSQPPTTSDGFDKRDGEWLADHLGIDPQIVKKIRNSEGRDQADARAMNAALWPATLGYWMDTMMDPVFPETAVRQTREFFTRFVSGRGPIPAVRIGRQPYGILPTTAFSRMAWFTESQGSPVSHHYLARLAQVLSIVRTDWNGRSGEVSHVGKSGDPHQMLLDIVGLHSGSVEYSQRVAESAEHLYNRLTLDGLGGFFSALVVAGLFQSARDLLVRFGYTGSEDPDMLKRFFLGEHQELTGGVIDDVPLSESSPIRIYTADGTQNYIQWLVAAAETSIRALYAQEGFRDDRPPRALLYLMLRHALQLGYHGTSLRMHEASGVLSNEDARAARRETSFLHIREPAASSESRYAVLYKSESAITGHPSAMVGDFIGQTLHTNVLAESLREQVHALRSLQDASTARLERAFAEHVDCCSYRLDAWLVGLVHAQLDFMRHGRPRNRDIPTLATTTLAPSVGIPPSSQGRGLYLGAFAWLEDVRPDRGETEEFHITDPEIENDFLEPGARPIRRDANNEGFIHAPSLNQAVAAAVLRSGYTVNAGSLNPDTMAVNVSSERVRDALGILEGIRGGQSLGALLGYHFERGLHDAHQFGAELDAFILKLRREFPLVSNRQASTKVEGDDLAIETIEARNVVDGYLLVEHVRKPGQGAYKFGIDRLPDATTAQAAAIDAEVQRLLELYDAVADLSLAEGVYQAVQGNYDRVASTLDAPGKGNLPPDPLVARTPVEGIGLTHRVGLHLELASSAVAPHDTPRSLGEPAVNRWLASVLPSFDDVGCVVEYVDSNGDPASREVLLGEIGIQPLDLLQLLRDDLGAGSWTELDERMVTVIADVARPDGEIHIRYRDTLNAPIAIFQVMPLARHLRRLLGAARPLRATDLSLAGEANRADDADPFVDPQRLQNVMDKLQTLQSDLEAFEGELSGPLADPAANRNAILAHADEWIDKLAALLARASSFGMPQMGWGFAYDYRTRAFRSARSKARDLVKRWDDRLDEFDATILEYDALPGSATDDERLRLLGRAESLVSTETMSPFPATLAGYRAQLDTKRGVFDSKRQEFDAIAHSTRLRVTPFLADIESILPVDRFEFPALSTREEDDLIVAFAQDAQSTLHVAIAECIRRIEEATRALNAPVAGGEARFKAAQSAATALLGADLVLVPQFSLTADQGNEIASALAESPSLLDYLRNTVQVEEPVDTWMYGVARVRESMRDWEQVVLLSEALGGGDRGLVPIQLPFQSGDRWLALEFPPGTKFERERVLYTAHYATPFDRTRPQCGLLLAEWSEVIPRADTTTGLSFHYDRPSSEAPQAMLLVTPTAFRGAWQWADLVDALNETLDLAKLRGIEPVHIDGTRYAQFLPTTIMAVTMRQLTISANLALNNDLLAQVAPDE